MILVILAAIIGAIALISTGHPWLGLGVLVLGAVLVAAYFAVKKRG